jgi:hypothetical protein
VGKHSAEGWFDTHHIEEVCGHDLSPDVLHASRVAKGERTKRRYGEAGNEARVALQIPEVRMGKVYRFAGSRDVLYGREAAGVRGAGNGIQENGINPAENCTVRGDTKGHREHRRGRKSRMTRQ